MSTYALRQDVRVIGLVALAHGLSHFYQIATAVLFPLIREDLGVSYAALGATIALYYVVSGVCQTLAGFAVDRFGARRVLFSGLVLCVAGAVLAGTARSYQTLVLAALVAGLGNSVFHPSDFAILNTRVHPDRLGYAFSWHGIAGFLGYAAAPVFCTAMASSFGWRAALLAAAGLGAAVTAFVMAQRAALYVEPADARRRAGEGGLAADLRVLASAPVLMCFGYFFFIAVGFIAIQTFGVATLIALYGASAALASAALTAYLVGAAAGIFTGGFAAARFQRHDLVAIAGMLVSAALMFVLASAWLPVTLLAPLLAATGFASGVTNPSRDLIVRATTPPGATGKVYGFVYSGLDVGSMLTPILFGWLLDRGQAAAVFYAVVIAMALTILTVLQLPGRPPR
ncbi:MAG: MFS transporter [Betaproteobacteria bacterium]|nr:MAG: MFS transporter [Betaproteobacteria bacterium]